MLMKAVSTALVKVAFATRSLKTWASRRRCKGLVKVVLKFTLEAGPFTQEDASSHGRPATPCPRIDAHEPCTHGLREKNPRLRVLIPYTVKHSSTLDRQPLLPVVAHLYLEGCNPLSVPAPTLHDDACDTLDLARVQLHICGVDPMRGAPCILGV